MANKKGNLDTMTIPILLLVLAVGVFAFYYIIDSATAAFAGDATASNLMSNTKTMFLRIGNSSFVMMAFALILFNLISSFLMITHPVFMIIDIILLPLSVMIATIISNAYEASLYTLSIATQFPVMNFFMLHLPTIIVIVDVMCAIAAYALVKQ